MRCYICDEDATEISRGDQQLVDCSDCGAYAISGTVIRLRNQDIRTFRVIDTRAWLDEQRETGESRPLLNTSNVQWD